MRQIKRKIYSDEIKYGFGLYLIFSIMKKFELSKKTVSVDLRVSRIYRHLMASPSFGGQIAGTGGTPRLS